jgi:hypothetical protein
MNTKFSNEFLRRAQNHAKDFLDELQIAIVGMSDNIKDENHMSSVSFECISIDRKMKYLYTYREDESYNYSDILNLISSD